MKSRLTIILGLLVCWSGLSQFDTRELISDQTDLALTVDIFDLDQDGFVDVLSASPEDRDIRWYRNLDGEGTFDDYQILADVGSILQMELADIDGDSDLDIVYRSYTDYRYAWLENLDGMGTFSEDRIIATSDFHFDLKVIDMDNDGDLDIVSLMQELALSEDRIGWFENLDGLGNFSEELVIDFVPYNRQHITVADLNNDNFPDIITTYLNDDPFGGGVYWTQNNPEGGFMEPEIIHVFDNLVSSFTEVIDLKTVDVNDDGFLDIVLSTVIDFENNRLIWFENLDGTGNFANPATIDSWPDGLFFFKAFDLDNDGDQDIVGRLLFPGSLWWFENQDGLGDFTTRTVIAEEPLEVWDIDMGLIDSDALMDLAFVSRRVGNDHVAWLKNLGGLSVNENTLTSASVYPNPSSGIVEVKADFHVKQLQVFSLLGQELATVNNKTSIDLSYLHPGIYLLQITNNLGQITTKRIVIN